MLFCFIFPRPFLLNPGRGGIIYAYRAPYLGAGMITGVQHFPGVASVILFLVIMIIWFLSVIVNDVLEIQNIKEGSPAASLLIFKNHGGVNFETSSLCRNNRKRFSQRRKKFYNGVYFGVGVPGFHACNNRLLHAA